MPDHGRRRARAADLAGRSLEIVWSVVSFLWGVPCGVSTLVLIVSRIATRYWVITSGLAPSSVSA